MEEVVVPLIAIPAIVLGLPWIIFHYITRWKTAKTLTSEDENLLDDLHEMARRLDDRLATVERIMTAENPNWRALSHDPVAGGDLSDLSSVRRLQK